MLQKTLSTAVLAMALLLGGCTAGLPNFSVPVESTGLTIQLAADREVQALQEEVASVQVKVRFGNETFRETTVSAVSRDKVLDLKNLRDGLAEVEVTVFNDAGVQIGNGHGQTALQIGRRNFLRITVRLDSKGKTTQPLATPLELLN